MDAWGGQQLLAVNVFVVSSDGSLLELARSNFSSQSADRKSFLFKVTDNTECFLQAIGSTNATGLLNFQGGYLRDHESPTLLFGGETVNVGDEFNNIRETYTLYAQGTAVVRRDWVAPSDGIAVLTWSNWEGRKVSAEVIGAHNILRHRFGEPDKHWVFAAKAGQRYKIFFETSQPPGSAFSWQLTLSKMAFDLDPNSKLPSHAPVDLRLRSFPDSAERYEWILGESVTNVTMGPVFSWKPLRGGTILFTRWLTDRTAGFGPLIQESMCWSLMMILLMPKS